MHEFSHTMHSSAEGELRAAERGFQDALRCSDVDALDGLLDDRARFLGPDGITIGKAADLEVHRSGSLRLDSVTEIAHETEVLGETGITRVVLRLNGVASGEPLTALTIAYTRVWHRIDGGWRIVAAQGGVVA